MKRQEEYITKKLLELEQERETTSKQTHHTSAVGVVAAAAANHFNDIGDNLHASLAFSETSSFYGDQSKRGGGSGTSSHSLSSLPKKEQPSKAVERL